MKPVDIGPADLETVRRVLREHVPGLEVWAFGSRVSWTARGTSDLDIALMTTEPLDAMRLAEMREAFVQSDLPFRVDIADWSSTSKAFQSIIRQNCVVVQEKTTELNVEDKWRKVQLGSVAEIVGGGTPSTKVLQYFNGDVPWLTPKDLANAHARYIFRGKRNLSQEGLDSCSAKLLPRGAVLLSTRAPVGYVAIAGTEIATNQGFHSLLFGNEVCSEFAYYWLKGNTEELKRHASGSTFQEISGSALKDICIPLPPIPDQEAIAHILGTLDDKIELNRQMNRTLEEMAQALFKSWFVDFDPIRAKMDGRWRPGESLPGLPAYLYDLFPDRLDSKLGKVPKGWKIGVLDDAIELLSGGTPRTSIAIYWGGDIPWYTAKDAPLPSDIFVLDTERTITQAGVTNSSTKILPIGTTVITARGTVGRLACLGAPMAMNQTCYGIRGIRGYSDFFTYWNVRMAVDQLQRRTHGTIFDTITRQTFKLVDTVLPPTALAEVFESMVSSMMERMLGNARECRALSAQRDALLPKLMSGELRIFQLVHGRNTTK